MTGLLLDNDMDLLIQNGDFVLGDTTAQNQKILILSNKTEFKENPMRCVGTMMFLEDHKPDALAREIRQEFITDGMKVNTIVIKQIGDIEVDATYQ